MSTKLKIAGIIKESIVDGPGIRLVVFGQGCRHNCPGCHNPETHSFDGGTYIEIQKIVDMAKKNPLLDGVTFSGGDPFEQPQAFAALAAELQKTGLNIMTYTGYKFEYLLEHAETHKGWMELLKATDILIDGRFEADKKNLLLKFRGSENQRVIDVKESLTKNEVSLINW